MKNLLEKELRDKGETEGRRGRQKRQIVEFRISTHLKWDRVIPYKFDGNHSKNFLLKEMEDRKKNAKFTMMKKIQTFKLTVKLSPYFRRENVHQQIAHSVLSTVTLVFANMKSQGISF